MNKQRLLTLCLALVLVMSATLTAVASPPIPEKHLGSDSGRPAAPTAPVSSTTQVMRTGQRTCYHQEGWLVDCTETGQDGDIQAGVAWPNPRFEITYCDNVGPCADQSDDCDSAPSTDIVRDMLTGLVWARSGRLLEPSIDVTWNQALDFANNLTLCGYDDWRMPNLLELQSMTNAEFSPYTYPYPEYNWLHEAGFVDIYTEFYWSSTASDARPGWFFEARNMFGGEIDIEPGDHNGGNDWMETVWPVRAGQNGSPDPTYPANLWRTGQTVSVSPGDDGDLQMGVAWPEPRFTNPDGTFPVTGTCTLDNLTGLMWPTDVWPDPYENDTWQESLDRANNLALCGYDDWRLPNTWEMLSLIDFSQSAPALPAGHPFQNVSTWSWYATSTTFPWWIDSVYGLDLEGLQSGWLDFHVKSPEWWYTMPVRGGVVGTPLRPDLSIDYEYGKIGSFFTITGVNWAPNGALYVTVNGQYIGSLTVAGNGSINFGFLTGQGDEGRYIVTVTSAPPGGGTSALQGDEVEAWVDFWLDEDAPLWPPNGTAVVFDLPPGIGYSQFTYLPAVLRQ